MSNPFPFKLVGLSYKIVHISVYTFNDIQISCMHVSKQDLYRRHSQILKQKIVDCKFVTTFMSPRSVSPAGNNVSGAESNPNKNKLTFKSNQMPIRLGTTGKTDKRRRVLVGKGIKHAYNILQVTVT